MKKYADLRLFYVFCAIFLFAFFSCASTNKGDRFVYTSESENPDIRYLQESIAYLDAARLFGSRVELENREISTSSVISKIENLLSSSTINQSENARLLALEGMALLMEDKKSRAKDCYEKALHLYRGDGQNAVLGYRLGLIENLADKNSIVDSADKPLLLLEQAISFYEKGQYLQAVAQFDTSFISLDSYYREAYTPVRDRAWEMRSLPEVVSASEDKDKAENLLKKTDIDIGTMLLLTQEFSNHLYSVTGGKKLSESDLFKRVLASGKLSPISDAEEKNLEKETQALRILCARFLWNLFTQNDKSLDFTKYSTLYKGYNMESPVSDVEVSSPDFDAVLGCVENEIMTLPDGEHFFPEKTVSALEFSKWLSSVE